MVFHPHIVQNPCTEEGAFRVPDPLPDTILSVTNRNHDLLIPHGFMFLCNNSDLARQSHHWRCQQPGCPARINTTFWDIVRGDPTAGHTHDAPEARVFQHLFRWHLWCEFPTTKGSRMKS